MASPGNRHCANCTAHYANRSIGRHTFVPYYENNQHDETFHYKACYIVAMPPQIQQMKPWALRFRFVIVLGENPAPPPKKKCL